MRSTRAYIAGLGTAGSIVVGVALLFVLASAVVAYRGWPSMNGSDSPARQVISLPAGRGPSSSVSRRLAALTIQPGTGAPVAVTIARAVGARVRTATGAHARTIATGPVAVVNQPPISHRGGQAGGGGPAPTTQPTGPPTSTVPVTGTTPPTTTTTVPTTTTPTTTGGRTQAPIVKKVLAAPVAVVKQVTTTVGQTVASVGAGVGGTLQKVTGVVGGGL